MSGPKLTQRKIDKLRDAINVVAETGEVMRELGGERLIYMAEYKLRADQAELERDRYRYALEQIAGVWIPESATEVEPHERARAALAREQLTKDREEPSQH